jgi:hypothetical protein
MNAVIDKYAKDNSYTLILDVSGQANNVLFAADGTDVTTDVVALYDKSVPLRRPERRLPRLLRLPRLRSPRLPPPSRRLPHPQPGLRRRHPPRSRTHEIHESAPRRAAFTPLALSLPPECFRGSGNSPRERLFKPLKIRNISVFPMFSGSRICRGDPLIRPDRSPRRKSYTICKMTFSSGERLPATGL